MVQRFRALAAFAQDLGSRFSSQHPQVYSETSITPIPGNSMPSSDHHKQQACM